MKIKTWPKPPLKESYTIPEIPEEFSIFGITYKVTGNKVIPSELEPSKFNKDKIKALVGKSYSNFLELLCNPENNVSILENIESIHLEINVELNKCKDIEVKFEMKRIENENNRRKNETINELKDIIGW